MSGVHVPSGEPILVNTAPAGGIHIPDQGGVHNMPVATSAPVIHSTTAVPPHHGVHGGALVVSHSVLAAGLLVVLLFLVVTGCILGARLVRARSTSRSAEVARQRMGLSFPAARR